eukprot:NODE_6_length_70510_cov_1.054395.p20 type:complete len:422 gc:universal NODE_6_length_70510_cov_1.054395:6326-7591(+)
MKVPLSPTESYHSFESIPWYYSKSFVVSCTSMALFIDMLSYSIIIPILPEIITEIYHLSPDYLGILFGSYAFGLLIATPIFGALSDYFDTRKPFMLLGFFGLIVSSLFFMYGTTFVHLLIARFMSGVCGASSWSIGLSSIAAIATDDLGALIGSVLSWNFIGFTIGPLIGGFMFEFFGYQSVFFLIIALSVVAIMQRAIISEEYLVERKKQWLMNQDDFVDQNESFASLLTKPNVIVGLLVTICNGSILSGLEPVLPLYLSDKFSLNPSHIGLVFVVLAVPNILLSGKVGSLADKYQNLPIMIIGMILASLFNFLVGISTNLILELIFILLLGAANCLNLTPVAALIGSETQAYGKVYALFNAAWACGMFVGPSIASFIYASKGFSFVMCQFSLMFLLSAACCTIYLRYYLKPRNRIINDL